MQKSNMLTDPLYIATQLRRKIHGDKRLNLGTIAGWLGLTPSGLSHALNRPDKMKYHARRLAQALECDLSELTGLSNTESDAQLPDMDKHPQAKKRRGPVRGNSDAEVMMALVSPNFDLKERFNLDPDCQVQRLPPVEGALGGSYVLLGPPKTTARLNSRVFVQTKDGRSLVMRYNVDASNPKLVVLMPEEDGSSPVVLKASAIKEIRLIVGEFIVR